MGWLPKHHYQAVELRCVLPACEETGEVGLGFNLPDGTVLRLRISALRAVSLMRCLADDQRLTLVASQSSISVAKPSVDGSDTPDQSV